MGTAIGSETIFWRPVMPRSRSSFAPKRWLVFASTEAIGACDRSQPGAERPAPPSKPPPATTIGAASSYTTSWPLRSRVTPSAATTKAVPLVRTSVART